jgi:hypothetical protein
MWPLLLVLGIGGAAAAAFALKGGSQAPLATGKWFKITFSGSGDPATLTVSLPTQGFYPVGGLIVTSSTEVSAIGFYVGTATALTPILGWNVKAIEAVNPPPAATQPQLVPSTLDSTITVQEAQAVVNALAQDPNAANLAHFADVMLPDYPTAASLLKTHATNLGLAQAAPAQTSTSGTRTGAASAYESQLAAVGFHPDNPDGMYASLMASAHQPGAYTIDNGVATIMWPFHSGRWVTDCWLSGDNKTRWTQIRVLYKLPSNQPAEPLLMKLYGIPAEHVKLYAGSTTPQVHVSQQSTETHTSLDPNVAIKAAAAQMGDAGKVMLQVADAASSLVKTVTFAEPLDSLVHDIATGKSPMDIIKDMGTSTLQNAKDIAPYVESVTSLVPGIGPEAAAGLALGCALAEGKPISDAAIEAAAAAVPGGPIAQQAFRAAVSIGSAISKGQSIGDAALAGVRAALPPGPAQSAFDAATAIAKGQNPAGAIVQAAAGLIGPAANSPLVQSALASASNAVAQVAAGKSPGDAILNQARAALPPAAQGAFDSAVAVAKGQSPAAAVMQGLAAQLPPGPAKDAAMAGAGIAAQVASGKSLDAVALDAVRAHLPPAQQKVFDAGLALAHGGALQKAGFPSLRNFLPGDTAAQATMFAKVAQAAMGNPMQVQAQLESMVRGQLAALGPAAGQDVRTTLAMIVKDPSLAGLTSAALAAKEKVAEPIARAALACIVPPSTATALGHIAVKTGEIDKLLPPAKPLPLKLSAIAVTKRIGPAAAKEQAKALLANPAPAAQAKALDLARAAQVAERVRLVAYYLALPMKKGRAA